MSARFSATMALLCCVFRHEEQEQPEQKMPFAKHSQ
jgi:hypothetical protein